MMMAIFAAFGVLLMIVGFAYVISWRPSRNPACCTS